ncbi:sulfate permease [Micrococcus terreus]|uniref:sulfate permease n=1 Tax=Micrococcus terreus TaxID=574650 RepID=UPI0023FA28EB|nr:sulfate permease [Micrococcus terreus]
MFRLIWAASVRTHAILNYAPTNILIAATRTRRGLRWGIPAMLLAIPYFLASHWCVTAIEAGGPGWLNLLVLLCGWNSIKLTFNGPVTVVLLIRARIRETVAWRRAHQAEYDASRLSDARDPMTPSWSSQAG